MQEKPEVIAYLRYLHSDDALPDWVGKLKDKVDYAEILRKEGIELPAIVDDASMSVSEDDDRVNVEEEDTEDVQEGTPVQASVIGATDFSARANKGDQGQSRADTHGHASRSRTDTGMKDTADARKESQKTVPKRSSKIPDPIVNPNPEVLPVVIKKPQYTKRGMGGSATLEEKTGIAEARASRVG